VSLFTFVLCAHLPVLQSMPGLCNAIPLRVLLGLGTGLQKRKKLHACLFESLLTPANVSGSTIPSPKVLQRGCGAEPLNLTQCLVNMSYIITQAFSRWTPSPGNSWSSLNTIMRLLSGTLCFVFLSMTFCVQTTSYISDFIVPEYITARHRCSNISCATLL
jgi:hypothetical protein